ncbi:MAG: hypothetical protein A2W03_08720 [Candidatus Aminicenantes bacterium RBG_16_63_16]|nr:MAG: hypothetical protein A2W03_08720 [Candidatus Aminicenantes bacterium RBG_16_63_16]
MFFLAGVIIFAGGRALYAAAGFGDGKGIPAGPPETHRFVSDASIPISMGCYAALAGDLRNDGVNRIVAGTWSSHCAYVFRKQGTTYVEDWNHLYAAGDNVIPVALGDVDNDGQNEFLISVRSTGIIYMYRWDGATYQKVHEQYFGGNYMPAAIFDIDRDGANELIVDGSGASPIVSVFNYDSGSGTFLLAWSAPKGDALQIAVGDPDNDGQREAVIALPWDYPPGKMMIIGYDGSAYSVEGTITSFPQGLGGAAVADFDGDGKDEIITGLYNVAATQFPVYLVKHDGAQYNVTSLYDAGDGTFQVNAGDIDRDGLPEAVVMVSGQGPLVVEYQGNAYSASSVPLSGGLAGDLADMDGDNRAEIIAAPYSIQIISDIGGRSYIAANLDGSAGDEVLSDLATSGLWYFKSGVWTQLTPIEPEGMAAADTDGDAVGEVAADFGSLGIWLWNGGAWSQLTGLNPEGLVAGGLDGSGHATVIADFGPVGLWKWKDSAWSQMTGGNVQEMLLADTDNDGAGEFVGDFGSIGLWLWNGGAWTELSAQDADLLAKADTDATGGEEVLADFGALGLWLSKAGVWTQLSGARAECLAAGNVNAVPGDEVFADFGAVGLWVWASIGWTQFSGANADFLVLGDIDGTHRLAADFGGLGLWLWDNPAWSQLSAVNPDTLAAADPDADGYGEFVADFGATGIWLWNEGSWSQIK